MPSTIVAKFVWGWEMGAAMLCFCSSLFILDVNHAQCVHGCLNAFYPLPSPGSLQPSVVVQMGYITPCWLAIESGAFAQLNPTQNITINHKANFSIITQKQKYLLIVIFMILLIAAQGVDLRHTNNNPHGAQIIPTDKLQLLVARAKIK